MQQHVKILGILHIALSGLGVLAALVLMSIFGGVAGFLGMSEDGAAAGGVLGLIGACIVIFILVISVPGLIAGIGLLTFQPWARILTIILSVLELPGFPFHTALGIFGLWVLLSPEGTALFQQPALRPVR